MGESNAFDNSSEHRISLEFLKQQRISKFCLSKGEG